MRRFVQSVCFSAAVLGAVAPVAAVTITFAQYSQPTSGASLRWVRSGANAQLFTTATPTASAVGNAHVNFSFLQPYLAGLGTLPASLRLTATVTATPALSAFGTLFQQNINGNFSFTYTGLAPLVVGQTSYATGANLLSGSFTQALIIGGIGSSAGYLSDATGSGTVSYTSDFLDFSNAPNRSFSLALSSVTPGFSAASGAPLANFRSGAIGSFASDAPSVTATIPEPASWALMFIGFTMLGSAVRRRRRTVAA